MDGGVVWEGFGRSDFHLCNTCHCQQSLERSGRVGSEKLEAGYSRNMESISRISSLLETGRKISDLQIKGQD